MLQIIAWWSPEETEQFSFPVNTEMLVKLAAAHGGYFWDLMAVSGHKEQIPEVRTPLLMCRLDY